MTSQMFLRQDLFGKNPWQGPRPFMGRSTLAQGCSIPKGESGGGGGGMISPATAPSDKPWLIPAIAAGGVAAIGGALWAFGVL